MSLTDPPVEVGIILNGIGPGGSLSILYTDIPGNSWNKNRLNKFVTKVQDMIDVRTPLDDPNLVDDPHGPNGVDPARPSFFWDSGDLVARSIIISDVTFSADVLNFTLTRAK